MSWLWQQSDKRGHFIAGFLIALLVGLSIAYFTPVEWAMLGGLTAGTFAAFIKEERDSKDPQHHTADYRDAYATFLGAFTAAVILYFTANTLLIFIGVIL